MTAQVVAFAQKRVDLIVETATVAQTVWLASVLESRGDSTPVMATHISWDQSAVKGDAIKALLDRVYVPTPMAAFGSELEAATALREKVRKSAPDGKSPGTSIYMNRPSSTSRVIWCR
ncbi:hypothetical protein [Nocardia sp. NPDC005366]|uniref:hypothetical protein n=1 Tax=Nocardia sp. NPDC005366 TaxID=3156878 RepID=UPI00339FF85D